MSAAVFLDENRAEVSAALADLAQYAPITAEHLEIEPERLAPYFAAMLQGALAEPVELHGTGSGLGFALVALLNAVDSQIEALAGDESRRADLVHLHQVRVGLGLAHWGFFFDASEQDASKTPPTGKHSGNLREKAASGWRAFVAWGLEKPGSPQR
jgi:hypothetical protein